MTTGKPVFMINFYKKLNPRHLIDYAKTVS